MSLKEVIAELKEVNKKLDAIIDMFEAMKIFRETLEKWAKGEKVDFGGRTDTKTKP